VVRAGAAGHVGAMVLVDTDPAAGLPFCDVDDVLALHVLQRAGLLAGITTVWGNTSLARVHPVAEELGQRWGLPVSRGAARPGDVDTPAVDALCAHTGDVLAIGPLTNIAAALARGARWSRLVVLGGTERRFNLRYLWPTELNFALDEPAANSVMPVCTTLVPMEVCRTVLFGAAEVSHLPPWLRERVTHWLRIAPWMTHRRGFHPWDVLAALFLVDPSPFRTARRAVRCVGGPLSRGRIRVGTAGSVEIIDAIDTAALVRSWASVV